MKRIKYGVINNYDSWYENSEGMTDEEFFGFVDEKFQEYDAVCVLDGLKDSHYHKVVSEAMKVNKDLFIVPELIDVGKTNARIVLFDDVLTLCMPESKISSVEQFFKRAMDILLSVVGLIVAAIPMLLIALAIKITSPGPVLYKQRRLTIHKKEFDIYKFRTMIPDAEKFSGPKFAEKDDPRITKIGKILRACRLDELPQIFNILKGDMSVVGPRPERPVFVEQFEKEIENYDYKNRYFFGGRPTQCRKVHLDQCTLRQQSCYRFGQTPNHANPDHRRCQYGRLPDDFLGYPRSA
jgi:lipopolysaccharide/colanic/teichoic acid biosynthesis glycosyltransferase